MLEWLVVERLVVSAVLGSLIGVEREMHEKPAGFRTHVLVCMGAAIFALISVSIGEEFASLVDVSRVAAGIVTGIGFLAAGSIFRDKDRVRGMTTAAGIWVLAGVGMASGLGYYVLAVAATIISLVVLIVGRVLDYYLKRRN